MIESEKPVYSTLTYRVTNYRVLFLPAHISQEAQDRLAKAIKAFCENPDRQIVILPQTSMEITPPRMDHLTDLLNRVDDHLDRMISLASYIRKNDPITIDTLRLRSEIVKAIGELRTPPLTANAILATQAQGGDSDVAALQEAASPHGGYVGVCGVENCPHCKTQPVGDGIAIDPVGFRTESTITFDFRGVRSVLTEMLPPPEVEPQRQETWRDRPPLL